MVMMGGAQLSPHARPLFRLLGGLLLLLDAGLLLLQGRLLLELLDLGLLGLGLVKLFDQDLLVLELVALRLHVEAVVDVVVNLPSLAVLPEEAAKHALPADPEDLGRHASLGRTAALPGARVAPLPARRKILANAGPRVDLHGLANDQAVLDELPDVEAGVRHGDLAHLIRIKPDALAAALLDSRSEPLLHREPCHRSMMHLELEP